jgi:hypothetical protein
MTLTVAVLKKIGWISIGDAAVGTLTTDFGSVTASLQAADIVARTATPAAIARRLVEEKVKPRMGLSRRLEGGV